MPQQIELYPTPRGISLTAHTTAVVIDVFRTTTTLTTALANGCRFVLPAADVEQAMRLFQPYGHNEALLGGERDGRKIEGFQLGNSPAEYTAETVGNRVVVFTSTNGTPAILACTTARRILLGCFLNLDAVSRMLDADTDVAIVCAGNNSRFALEDFVCAGALCARLGRKPLFDDAATAARAAWRSLSRSLVRSLTSTSHARYLRSLNFANDLTYALQLNTVSAVPVFTDGRITLADVGAVRPVRKESR